MQTVSDILKTNCCLKKQNLFGLYILVYHIYLTMNIFSSFLGSTAVIEVFHSTKH